MNQFSLSDTPWRRRLVVLGLPSAFLVLGAWQFQRGSSGLEQEAAQLAAQASWMSAVPTVTPNLTVRFSGDSRAHGAEFGSRSHDDLAALEGKVLTDRVRLGLALATVLGGGVSLLAGGSGLTAAAWALRRSRRSRDALEAAFHRICALLPILLGGLTGGLALACSSSVLFEIAGWPFGVSDGAPEMFFLAPGLAATGATLGVGLLTIRQLRRSRLAFTLAPHPVIGREVAPGDAPGLWRFLAERAAEQQAPMPDHVAAGLAHGFFGTSRDVALKPGQALLKGRTLHVPLPMLAMLDAGEVATIIGHELAHFPADTEYAMRFLPISVGIACNRSRAHTAEPSGRSSNDRLRRRARPHLLEVAVAQAIAAIPTDRPEHDLTLEVAPVEVRHRPASSVAQAHPDRPRQGLQQSPLVDATLIPSASIRRDDEARWAGHRRRKPVHGYEAHAAHCRAAQHRSRSLRGDQPRPRLSRPPLS